MGSYFSNSSPIYPPIKEDAEFTILAQEFSSLKNINIDQAKEKILYEIQQRANQILADTPTLPFKSAVEEAFSIIVSQIEDEIVRFHAEKLGINYNTITIYTRTMLLLRSPLFFNSSELRYITLPKVTFHFRKYLSKDGSTINSRVADGDETEVLSSCEDSHIWKKIM